MKLPDLQVAVVAPQLGLGIRGRRLGPCPACRVERSGRDDRRPPIGFEGPRWKCHACQAFGDAVNLISLALTGRPDSYREVRVWLEERHHVVVEAAEAGPAAPARPRVPAAEIRALLRAGTPVAKTQDHQVLAFLEQRNLDAERIPAWVLPAPGHPVYETLTWFDVADEKRSPWWPRAWSKTWRLAAPMFNGHGELAGLHARAVTSDAPRKTTWPRGVDCSGLLFADTDLGWPLLKGTAAPSRVLICEGITDFWSAAQRAPEARPPVAILGIESGSVPALKLVAWPDGCQIFVATDPDPQGDRYAEQIADTLAPERVAYRVPLHLLRSEA